MTTKIKIYKVWDTRDGAAMTVTTTRRTRGPYCLDPPARVCHREPRWVGTALAFETAEEAIKHYIGTQESRLGSLKDDVAEAHWRIAEAEDMALQQEHWRASEELKRKHP